MRIRRRPRLFDGSSLRLAYWTRTGTTGPVVPPARPELVQGVAGLLALPTYSRYTVTFGPSIGCSNNTQAQATTFPPLTNGANISRRSPPCVARECEPAA